MINLRTSSRVFLYSCEKLGMRCSYNYWQFSENECAPFSKYIYEQKFEASILFFSLFLYLSCLSLFSVPFSAPLAPSSPLSPRLIFLGAVRIGSMARFRPPLETSHSTMPLVAPLDHDRPLRHCQPTLTSTVALLAKNQVRPGNWRSLIAVHHSFENPKLWKFAVFLFFFQQLDLFFYWELKSYLWNQNHDIASLLSKHRLNRTICTI